MEYSGDLVKRDAGPGEDIRQFRQLGTRSSMPATRRSFAVRPGRALKPLVVDRRLRL